MKKIISLLNILLIFVTLDVYASTNVEERTRDDLKVNSSIYITESRINSILKTPKVNEEEKVYDFADLFDDNEESLIYDNIKNYIDETQYDLAVVTINDNNKLDAATYAEDFYDYNYFGFDSSYSGLLFLIDMDNREIYISTSGYAIKMYNDNRINGIIDAGYNDLTNALYYDCIMEMIDKTSYYYNLGFPKNNSNLNINGTDATYEYSDEYTMFEVLFYTFLVTILLTTIITVIVYNKSRLKIKKGSVVRYMISERNPMINERYIRSNVTKIPINTDSSSGGFSRSGGSSIRVGSSGRSHGGGGRRF